MNNRNTIAQVLFVMGVSIIVLGVIGSFILGDTFRLGGWEFNKTLCFTGILSSAITGFLIIGLGEIIKLLEENRRLLESISSKKSSPISSNVSQDSYDTSDLPEI